MVKIFNRYVDVLNIASIEEPKALDFCRTKSALKYLTVGFDITFLQGGKVNVIMGDMKYNRKYCRESISPELLIKLCYDNIEDNEENREMLKIYKDFVNNVIEKKGE